MIKLTFQGAAAYDYTAEPDAGKISVPLEIQGVATTAVLDTATPYFICPPKIAAQAGFSGKLGTLVLRTHRGTFKGQCFRGRVRLQATEGKEIEFEATVFVPEEQTWNVSFLGFHCCLERIRFAVDPRKDKEMFYFADAGAD